MEFGEFIKIYESNYRQDLNSGAEDRISELYQGLYETGLAKTLTTEQARVILEGCQRFRDMGYSEGLDRGVVGMMPAR